MRTFTLHRPWAPLTLAALLLLAAGPAQSQVCDQGVREQFAQIVQELLASGADPAEIEQTLEDMFGHCRDDGTVLPPALKAPGTDLQPRAGAFKIVVNSGSIFYEQMTGCGYHPQAEQVSCDVELRQRFGYVPFPTGSTEHVLFCFDCNQDGLFEFSTRGNVHVTDDISGGPLNFYFEAHSTTFHAPAGCTANDGLNTTILARLSWFVPVATCTSPPQIWGNDILFTARRDP